MHIPVIVGMGGVNAAGRTSDHQSYRRMVIDELEPELREKTLASLAAVSYTHLTLPTTPYV